MSGSNISSEGLDARRRRLLFRAWHRGMREMDLIMGKFADAEIGEMSEADLDVFEQLSDVPDPELYDWIANNTEVPQQHDTALLKRLRAFHHGKGV